jgi:WD40 repeat protein
LNAPTGRPDNAGCPAAFSPDGKQIFSAGSFFDANNGKLLKRLPVDRTVSSAYFSPEGGRLLIGTDDGFIQLWDAKKNKLIRATKATAGSDSILAVTFSSDGKLALSEDSSALVKLWSGDRIAPLRTYAEVNSGSVRHSLAFSPDGTEFLTDGGIDDSDPKKVVVLVLVKNTATGAVVNSLRPDFRWAAAFSPDGNSILIGGQYDNESGSLQLYDRKSGTVQRSFEGINSTSYDVRFSPDGTRIVSGGGGANLKLWDKNTGELVRVFRGHEGPINTVGFSETGAVLTGSQDTTLRAWNLADGNNIQTFGVVPRISEHLTQADAAPLFWSAVGQIISADISPNGKLVATGNDQMAILWDGTTGKPIRPVNRSAAPTTSSLKVYQVAFSTDGRTLMTVNAVEEIKGEFRPPVLRFWDTESGKLIRSIERLHNGDPPSIVVSPARNKILSIGGDGHAKVWDFDSGKLLHDFRLDKNLFRGTSPFKGRFSSDNRQVALWGSSTLLLWDTETGQTLKIFRTNNEEIVSAAVSPDGRRLVSASTDGLLRVWDCQGTELLATLAAADSGEWLTLTPEGFFSSSEAGQNSINLVRGFEVFSVSQFFQALYRPDLVRQKLSADFDSKLRVRLAAHHLSLGAVLDSGRPPAVSIVSPTNFSTVDSDTVSVAIRLDDQGGGEGRLEWRVNGITLGIDQAINGAAASRTFSLGDGANVIEVVAYNQKNLVASLPASVVVRARSNLPNVNSRLYVMAIGVNRYEHPSLILKYAVPDALSVLKVFATPGYGNGLFADVITVGPLIDAEVTASNLDEHFARLSGIVRPDDIFVLYLAGHGITENGRYFFVPQNAATDTFETLLDTSIGQDKIQEWFSKIRARRSLVAYDTCESGSNTLDASSFRIRQQLVAVEKLSQSTGRTILAATTDTGSAQVRISLMVSTDFTRS